MTRKLVYEDTGVSVKPNDSVTVTGVGEGTIKNVRAPRKESGTGRVTILITATGQIADYAPSEINAIWK